MASWWQKKLAATIASVAGLTGLAGGVYYMLMRHPLPKIKGKLRLEGLHEPVEVITDRYGVPHIYAGNEDDLFFAQGYMHAQERLWQMEFNRRLGSGLLSLTNRYVSRSRPLLIRLMNAHDDSWFADSAMPNGPRTWDAALSGAFHAAIEELRTKLGDDISRWTYGAMHKMTYVHVLGLVKPLNLVFNRGPFPVGGDIDTVNMGATAPNQPGVVIAVPSYRQIVSLADMNASLSGHAPGQSGHVASKHYDDFIKPWLKVQHHPMLFERNTIEANAEGILHLLPG